MRKTRHSADYARFLATEGDAEGLNILQQELADKLGKPQSFVAKVERGERWVGVIEFIAIARALDRDPLRLLKQYLEDPLGKSGRPVGRS
jgi:transcriptional regulator with XRE-family HTH domain